MNIKNIAHTVAHTIQISQKAGQQTDYIFIIDFSHQHKPADGCLLVHYDAAQKTANIKSYDQQYKDIDDPLNQLEHASYLECDEDLDQRDELVTTLESALAATSA
ncbi:hypothetical protein [Lapidilactobacillus dextrinicus]|uniref:hypothetical protein n=1 Tax=Lapidilactobacillus dextrinicus TaxID=51664 RepID=UPI0022E7CA20|nr:hypothetical protein [Lapidilactobacillus dextrinicus]